MMKKILLFILFYISLLFLETVFTYIAIGVDKLLKLPPLGILYFKEISYGINLLFSSIIPGILTAKIMIYSNYKFNINTSNHFLLYPALIFILYIILSASVIVPFGQISTSYNFINVLTTHVFGFVTIATYMISIVKLSDNKYG